MKEEWIVQDYGVGRLGTLSSGGPSPSSPLPPSAGRSDTYTPSPPPQFYVSVDSPTYVCVKLQSLAKKECETSFKKYEFLAADIQVISKVFCKIHKQILNAPRENTFLSPKY